MAEDTLTFPHLRAVLEEYGKAAAERYKQQLAENDTVASGDLQKSIHHAITIGEQTIDVEIIAAEHWQYPEFGTRPHWAPIDALKKWVRDKGIEHEDKAISRAAYAIRWSIHENGTLRKSDGTRGKHDLETALSALDAEYTDRILDALKRDIEDGVGFMLIKAFSK